MLGGSLYLDCLSLSVPFTGTHLAKRSPCRHGWILRGLVKDQGPFKDHQPYQIFVSTSTELLDITKRTFASKISMVTSWSGRNSDLGIQPPCPQGHLNYIPLQQLCRTVPDDLTPPTPTPAQPDHVPVEVDDDDTQQSPATRRNMQPPAALPVRGVDAPLPVSPMQDSTPGTPSPPRDHPQLLSPPPATGFAAPAPVCGLVRLSSVCVILWTAAALAATSSPFLFNDESCSTLVLAEWPLPSPCHCQYWETLRSSAPMPLTMPPESVPSPQPAEPYFT